MDRARFLGLDQDVEAGEVGAGAGLDAVAPEELKVASAAESAGVIRAILGGEKVPARSVVVANAAAAIHVAGMAADLGEGVERASESIDSGEAYGQLDMGHPNANASEMLALLDQFEPRR